MTPEEELEPALAKLRSENDMLPFLEELIPAETAVFCRMPFEMADILASSPDFRPPASGSPPLWWQLEGEHGGQATIIVARPSSDGELWMLAPKRQG